MEFQDRILTCVDCGAEFVWTAGEQQFFADKNFKNEPKRCKSCKGKKASRPAGALSVTEQSPSMQWSRMAGMDSKALGSGALLAASKAKPAKARAGPLCRQCRQKPA